DGLPHIVGHSMGGLAAMAVATSNPQAIASLIVVDIAPVQRTDGLLKILDALMGLDLESVNSRADADKALSEKIRDPGDRRFLLQNLKRSSTGGFAWRCNLPELRRYAAEEKSELPPRAVYKGPTLVIAGGRSEYRVWEQEAILKTHFPAMILEILEDAGHWVHIDTPDRFVERLREWVSAHSAKA
ncbi:MAG TPA: alpha/beta fold hydrolase, partial [Thermodesulfobacteriota bacterium]|nr:alpha/beta fold hydrolase [Thermodesulfobacteriota bacterium]